MEESKKCKNKKCQRTLPEGYKYDRCENCRNKQVKRVRDAGKGVLGVLFVVGGVVLKVVTKIK